LALTDYDRVRKFRPNDPDVQKKYDEVNKIVKRIAFEKAIACDEPKSIGESIDINSYVVEDSYTGPRLDGEITPECKLLAVSKFYITLFLVMKQLIETFKEQGKLHIKYAFKIMLAIRKMLEDYSSLMEILVPDGHKVIFCCIAN
jgi:serine/threonine-protein phosphatase 5